MLTAFLSLAISITPPVIRACNVPRTMCATLESDCVAAGVDPDRCLELAQGVCPTNKCLACDRAEDACEAAGGACTALVSHCSQALTGCGCETPRCTSAVNLSDQQIFALCLAWPMAIGDDCEDPSAGPCFAALAWDGCDLNSCEYTACMEDMEALAVCGGDLPDSCIAVQACVDAEETAS